MANGMSDEEKRLTRQLLRNVAIFVGAKVAMFMALQFLAKRLRESVVSDDSIPFDAIQAYAKKDVEAMEYFHRAIKVKEDGTLGPIALFKPE